MNVKKKNFGQPSPEALRLLVIHMKNTSLPRILAELEQVAGQEKQEQKTPQNNPVLKEI